MITDAEGRKWLLTKFYELGCNKVSCLTNVARVIRQKGSRHDVVGSMPDTILGLENTATVIDIAEELGITGWSKVKIDTPILVSNDKKNWLRRHFAKYENGTVYCWLNGDTSWSSDGAACGQWVYVKLADDVNIIDM